MYVVCINEKYHLEKKNRIYKSKHYIVVRGEWRKYTTRNVCFLILCVSHCEHCSLLSSLSAKTVTQALQAIEQPPSVTAGSIPVLLLLWENTFPIFPLLKIIVWWPVPEYPSILYPPAAATQCYLVMTLHNLSSVLKPTFSPVMKLPRLLDLCFCVRKQ